MESYFSERFFSPEFWLSAFIFDSGFFNSQNVWSLLGFPFESKEQELNFTSITLHSCTARPFTFKTTIHFTPQDDKSVSHSFCRVVLREESLSERASHTNLKNSVMEIVA